jgi:hypothetical protein
MQDQTMKFDETEVIHAIYSLVGGGLPYPILSRVDLMGSLLNGNWKYAPKQMSYQGYCSQERMCEIESMKGRWDASGQSV